MEHDTPSVNPRQAYLLGSLDLAFASQIGYSSPELEAEVKALFEMIPCAPVISPVRKRRIVGRKVRRGYRCYVIARSA
jgi:hypothetical protein